MSENYIVEVVPETTVVEVAPLQLEIIIVEISGSGGASIPDPTGHNGEYLHTDGVNFDWEPVVETDPIFTTWLATTPPAYPADIPTTPGEVGAEPALGNPLVSGYILSSTDAGVRSWVEDTGGVTDHGNLDGPSLLDDDHTHYALLAGRTGGQTITGGTNATDDLNFIATSGIAASGSVIQFSTGNNGSLPVFQIDHLGQAKVQTNYEFRVQTPGANPAAIGMSPAQTIFYPSGVLVTPSSHDWQTLHGGQMTFNDGAADIRVGINVTSPQQQLTIGGSIGIGKDYNSTYYTIFQAGTQASDLSYTLPTTSIDGLLKNTTGILSWDSTSYLTAETDPIFTQWLDDTEVDITYADFVTAIGGSTLVLDRIYRITDFQTDYTIPETADSFATLYGVTEVLLVTATGVNTYNPIVISESYPEDIIEWTHLNDSVTGATTGVITYREVPGMIKTDFDWRVAKYRRWEGYPSSYTLPTDGFVGVGINDATASGTYENSGESFIPKTFRVEIDGVDTFKYSQDNGSTWVETGVACSATPYAIGYGLSIAFPTVTGYTLGDYWSFTASYAGNGLYYYYQDPSAGTGALYIDEPFIDTGNLISNVSILGVTIYSNNTVFKNDVIDVDMVECVNNHFHSFCQYVSAKVLRRSKFRAGAENIVFGQYNDNYDFYQQVSACRFGYSGRYNTFYSNVDNAYFGDYCRNNTFSSSVWNIVAGTNFKTNTFVSDANDSTVGQNFQNNTFVGTFYNNNIGDNFGSTGSNTFDDECAGNIIKGEFYINTIKGAFFNNIISGNFYSNIGTFSENNIIGVFANNQFLDLGECRQNVICSARGVQYITSYSYFNNNFISAEFLYGITFGSDIAPVNFSGNIWFDNLGANWADTVVYDVANCTIYNTQALFDLTGAVQYKEFFRTDTGHSHDGVDSKTITPTFAVDVEVTDPAYGFVLASTTPASTKRFRISVDDTGALTTTEII